MTEVAIDKDDIETEQKLININQSRLERRIKKAKLKKLMGRVTIKRKKRQNKKSRQIVEKGNIRTIYEQKFESYLKLLDIPHLIETVFCFHCNNFYYYGNNEYIPKTCMVCRQKFYNPKERVAYMARPDFIIDFNDNQLRWNYKYDTQHHRMNAINVYKSEYFKKVAVVRIDGNVHEKQTIKIKDYKQYLRFRVQGIKVFIVTNDDIDNLLDKKDNGKSLLELCHTIGDAVIDQDLYEKYCQGGDFMERTRKPI